MSLLSKTVVPIPACSGTCLVAVFSWGVLEFAIAEMVLSHYTLYHATSPCVAHQDSFTSHYRLGIDDGSRGHCGWALSVVLAVGLRAKSPDLAELCGHHHRIDWDSMMQLPERDAVKTATPINGS